MTTRADLIAEREALAGMLADNLSKQDGMPPGARRLFDAPIAALTASIARLDALLSLSDEHAQCRPCDCTVAEQAAASVPSCEVKP